jgi:hypothetical protein
MNAAGHFSEPLAEQWDGTTWSVAPTTMANNGALANVTCLSASACWAVGAFSVPPGQGQQNGWNPQNLIEEWDGSTWSVDGSPDVTAISVLYGVACWRGAQCFATGLSVADPNNFTPQTLTEETTLPAAGSQGFEAVAGDGGMFNLGDAGFYGSMGGHRLVAPTVGTAVTADDRGYWLVAADGGVFSFGDAGFYGSMAGSLGGNRATALAATPDGGGYWLLGRDGGVFAFGNTGFFGSVPEQGLVADAPVTGISVSPDGRGYWLVAANGSVDNFGDASWLGALNDIGLRAPLTGVSQSG